MTTLVMNDNYIVNNELNVGYLQAYEVILACFL